MIRIVYYIFLVITFNFYLIFPQAVTKVLVSGEVGFEQHDLDVATAFLIGYGSYDSTPFPGTIDVYSYNLETSFIYADVNSYNLIVRSYEGLSDAIITAADYPSIKLVMPSGSNIFEETFTGDVINSPVIITGAGVDSNVTGYQIEFYSVDPITPDTLSSFANGYIAGQLSFIANKRGCSFDDARMLARKNSSSNGIFDYYNGFGTINIGLAINDPLPVELSSFSASVKGSRVLLEWKTETEINDLGFNIERSSAVIKTSWKTIGFVKGNGNSNSPKYYYYTDADIHKTGIYNYRLKQIDNDGSFIYSNEIVVNFSFPENFSLSQNYPNPFNPITKINFSIPAKQPVTLQIYNTLGEEVVELLNEIKDAGSYSITFNGSNLPSGVYICCLLTADFSDFIKMTLLK